MGRKKIQISRITDERNRQVTFNKRKFGVMKKAYELSVLCDCEIALIIFSSSNKLYQYASTDMDKVLLKYTEYNEPHESLTNKNIIEKENKNGTMSPDSPEQDDSYTLTPRTEAKFSKIDEEFQMMMQRNQQIASNRMGGSGNYSLPVSVPVGSYNESNMLQASPQMAHQSISPRPSSETDSVYQSGGILEMSNGYPASPLGHHSPSSPSPNIGAQNNRKSHHIVHKQQHSPVGSSSRSTNLRVVIPASSSNLSTDDLTYAEHNRQPSSTLNTPVVALQTPIPGIGYSVSSFGAQDFSMTSADLSMITWNSSHQNLGNLQHTSGIPHLAVSNSTPPPSSSSPAPVKIKSEPISPPRDQLLSQQQQSIVTSLGGSSTISVLNHSSLGNNMNHQHLISSRPSSTGHLTPTPGSSGDPSSPGDMRHTNQSITMSSHLPDYESSNSSHPKRPRISEGWAT